MPLLRPWSVLTVRQKPYWVAGLSEDGSGCLPCEHGPMFSWAVDRFGRIDT